MKYALVLLFTVIISAQTFAADRPNILFILTDDQAPWALGVSGNPQAHTPHLDELFQSGAYLVNSFTVTPVCSPSRASTISSRYGTEVGITDWINPRNEPDLGLDPATPTFPKKLHESGYETALIGKWHLGTLDKFHPTVFGYGYFMGFREGGTTPFGPNLEVNGQMQKVQGLTTDILTDEAIRWLRLREQKQDQPFLLCLHYRAPHARWLPVRDEDWEPYAELDPEIPNPEYPNLDVDRVKKMMREYLASVSGVDRNVGRLLAELELLKYHENTIVIYSSDHGYNMGHNGIWHKGNGHWVVTDPPAATDNIPRGQRPNMYDHSLRVPTAVRWPSVTKPGTWIEETVTNLDWFPTLLDVAGIEQEESLGLRGKSIVPVLKGTAPDWENDFYAQYTTHHQSRTQMRMYRTPEWKLIRDYLNEGRDELYDLKNDPAERNNLIDSADPGGRQALPELDRKLRQHMAQVQDPVHPDSE
ncbi:MAG: sulfatase-like hydrolase/transferase [Planctomycetaceae bacterium]|nr:sulfatase-like hydrolase/transferase [Planctomycetaceae bacterium]